ncbi:hypothetical protein [Comamonas kerstersii]|nr:hypothetical protein [Comamonas kerstersii]
MACIVSKKSLGLGIWQIGHTNNPGKTTYSGTKPYFYNPNRLEIV